MPQILLIIVFYARNLKFSSLHWLGELYFPPWNSTAGQRWPKSGFWNFPNAWDKEVKTCHNTAAGQIWPNKNLFTYFMSFLSDFQNSFPFRTKGSKDITIQLEAKLRHFSFKLIISNFENLCGRWGLCHPFQISFCYDLRKQLEMLRRFEVSCSWYFWYMTVSPIPGRICINTLV